MKKFFAIGMILMLLMGTFTGCASKSETTTEPAASDEAAPLETLEGKTITIGRWGGNEAETAAFTQMVTDFTATTGIIVEERVYSDYNTELQAALIGNEGPDVFYVDAYMAPFFINQGILMTLDANEFELDQFYPPLKDAFLSEGNYYAISKDYSTLALYYNKKWVNEADLPKSLEELWTSSYLKDLKATLPEGTVAMTYNQDLARNMFIAQNGGLSLVDENGLAALSDEKIAANLQPLFDAAIRGDILTPQDLGMGWNGDAFGNEKTALMIEGNWTLGFLEQNFPDVDFGVIEVPTYKGQQGTMVFTVGYAVNASSKEEAASKTFIKYATGTEGMATWTTGAGVLPSRIDVANALKVEEDVNKKAHIAGAAYATAWQKGVNMDTINTEYKNYLPSVIKGERTLIEALKIIQEEANATISSN